MQEILQQLKSKAGLNDDQANKALQVMTDFIGQKFPMIKSQLAGIMGDSKKDKGGGAPQVGGIDLGGLG